MAEDTAEEIEDEAEEEEPMNMDEIENMSLDDLQAEADDDDFGFDSGVDSYHPISIPLERLTANNWNPNEMSSEEFNRLCENIEEDGFLSALQAVPVDDEGNNMHVDEEDLPEDPEERAEYLREEMDHARIVGGEHRWSAAKVVGMTELPVNLVPNKDKDWEKLATVRMNAISGDLDPIQFAELVEEQRKKMDDQELKHALGFAGEETLFDQVLEDVKESVPDDVKEEIEEAEDDIETIDDLSDVLNRIFREHGDDLDYHFISFSYGGEDNVMYQADDELWVDIDDINDRMKALDASAIEFWKGLLENADVDEVLESVEGTADIKVDEEEDGDE